MPRFATRTPSNHQVSTWGRPLVAGGDYETFDTTSATVTASSTTHTKGSWTQIIAATTIDAGWLVYNYTNFTNGQATAGLLDIGIGAAGSEVVLIANLPCGYGNDATQLVIPICIPAGSRISARAQSAISSRQTTCKIGVRRNTHGMQLTTVDTFNADTSTSSFTTSMGTAYSELVASTSSQYRAMAMHVAHRTDTAIATAADIRVSAAIGAAGAETDVANLSRNANSSEYFTFAPVGNSLLGVYLGDIPSGSRLAAKAATTSSSNGVLLYCVR